jgi:hypothetical protein
MPTLNTRIVATGTPEAKEVFEIIKKSYDEFYKGTKESWKKQTEMAKAQKEATAHVAVTVSGPKPDNIVGAFDLATKAATAFGAGMLGVFGAAAAATVGFGAKAIQEFASIEDGTNRLLATGKVTHDQIEEYKKDWERLGPVVNKNTKQIMADYEALLLTNDKLSANFPQMEKFTRVTGASFANVLAMANTAAVGGVKPSEMPAYLDKAAVSFKHLGDNGVVESARVSRAYRNLGIEGASVQNQINVDIAALSGYMGGANKAADVMIRFIEQAAAGKGDSKMQGMIKNLRDGSMTLNEFFDTAMKRTDPAGRRFQLILENDPITRDMIQAWQKAHPAVDALLASTEKIDDNPLFTEGTSIAINRLAGSFDRLLEASGALLNVVKIFNSLADSLGRMSDAMDRFHKTGNIRDALDATGGLYKLLPGGAFIDMLIPPTQGPGVVPEGPGARSIKKPTPDWFQGGTAKPVFFSGSGGMDDAQSGNESDIHEMIMEEERRAAFTPGAGEGAWSPYAMIPPGGAGYGHGGFRHGIGSAYSPEGGGGGGGSGGGRRGGGNGPSPVSTSPSSQPSGPGAADQSSSAYVGAQAAAMMSPSGQSPEAFIMHHTSGRGTPQGVVDFWRRERPGIGAQYIMDREGRVWDTAKELGYGGTSHMLTGWGQGQGLSNRNTVGMEVIAKNNQDWSEAQKKNLPGWMEKNFPNTRLLGHGQVNPGHKEADEGMTGINAIMADRAAKAAAPPAVAAAAAAAPDASAQLTVKPKVEIVPPERHEIEKAARHQYRATGGVARRHRQSAAAGNLGYA